MGEGQSRVVLIVDDSSEVREYYQRVLRRAGYRVVLAGEGERALEVVRQIRPDCIVLDVMMPELDGLGVLRRLPEEVPKVPPVVVTSGFEWPEVEALARGARFFLRKPLAQEDLLACVEAAIDGRDLAERNRIIDGAQATRASALAARDALLGRVDVDALQTPLQHLVSFLAGWFGFGACAVHLPRRGHMHVEAVAGDPRAARFSAEGEPGLSWCAQVVDGGSALLIGDVCANPTLQSLPAAQSGSRLLSGVPILTRGGLILGSLCLVDHDARTLHSEDMAVLEQCAQGVGQRIEAMATASPIGKLMIAGSGLVTRHGLHVLVDAHLRAARRLHDTVELTLFELATVQPLEPLAEEVYGVLGKRGVAAARYADRVLGILQRGRAPEELHIALDDALQRLSARATPAGVGVVSCEVGDLAVLPAVELERMADETRARASVSGGVERVVLRREPIGLHAPDQ
jgi:CheY-like chemotaxis protein